MDTRKVLVVDDMISMRLLVRDMLEEMGFSAFEEAEDGESALEVLRNQKIDLVVSDFNMCPRTGLELLKEVKADPTLREIPFIMVTSESDAELARDAHRMGVSAFMKKPLHFNSFRDHVQTVVGAK